MKQILLVDGLETRRSLMSDYFAQINYKVTAVMNEKEALAAVQEADPDLVILDVNLADMSGCDFMRQHGQKADTPLIMLTNKGDARERIAALEAGADLCIESPCSMRELAARAQAVLRRCGKVAPRPELLVAGDMVLDRTGRNMRMDGSYVDLTPSEFELLAAFMAKPGYTLSREECARSIDSHIKNLRAKIEPDPNHPQYVTTVYGSGYRFTAAQ